MYDDAKQLNVLAYKVTVTSTGKHTECIAICHVTDVQFDVR